MEVEIREGFLCPICVQDLGSVTHLHQHFEQVHSNEDKDVVEQLKGLFGKAKRKLLGRDEDSDEVFGSLYGTDGQLDTAAACSGYNAGGFDPTFWEPQLLGVTRSHTDEFKRVRDARIDRFVIETNKLLIRLDKLLSPDAPLEPAKRKSYEKSVVPWARDSDVNLCSSCGKSFNITRRRHHCRLCGGIICNQCSHFLPFFYAKKMTDPSFRYSGEGFRRSSSNSSLNSLLSPEGEQHIRTCQECRVLLERRDQQLEQRLSKPLVLQIYEKMKIYMDEIVQILPKYQDMAESLRAGDTTYNLEETQRLKLKIVRLYESTDSLSKRIATLGSDTGEPPAPKASQLQRMVRLYATSFIQENVMGLQSLPTPEELAKLQENKRAEIQRRIEEERRAAALEEQNRMKRESDKPREPDVVRNTSPSKRLDNLVSDHTVVKSGWKPTEISHQANKDDDPMLQQMNIIRSYINQARQAQKLDEVQMLEENLKDLQSEYLKQQLQ